MLNEWGLKAALLLLACLSGCATKGGAKAWQVLPAEASDAQVFAKAERALRELFPSRYCATHRAIITVRQRQFVCDGFLTASPAEGWHLALVSTLGLITEVRVRADGASDVLKVTPLFREDWSREHVVRGLRWLFAPPPLLKPAGRLGDGRLVLEGTDRANDVQARYLCASDGSQWEELQLIAGSRRVCHAQIRGYRSFAGFGREVPADIEVNAGTHRLHLRVVALSVTSPPAMEAPR